MNRVILFLFAITLAGCAGRQAMNDITAACTRSDGNISSDCARNHPSFANLPRNAQMQVTHRVVINEQLKAGKITQAQADLMQQEYESKLLANEAAANAQASQATSNAMMSTSAYLLAADAANRPRQTNTTCNAFMGTMNCRSY